MRWTGTERRARSILAAAAALAVLAGCGLLGGSDGPREVTYVEVAGTELRLDAYVPDGDGGAPVLLVLHDGGWDSGSPADWSAVATTARDDGWAVVVPEYRLTGEAPDPWPGALTDAQAALRWIAGDGAALGMDPTRVAVLGGSAGGQLAALLGTVGATGDPLTATVPTGQPTIAAVATWSAPLDLAPLVSVAGTAPPGCDGALVCERFWQVFPVIAAHLGCSPAQCPDTYDAASPLGRAGPDNPPMLLVNGTQEPVPASQPRAMAAALQAVGVHAEVLLVPGARHSRGYADEVLDETLAFLRTEVDDR